jgi:hypothetical protein
LSLLDIRNVNPNQSGLFQFFFSPEKYFISKTGFFKIDYPTFAVDYYK